MYTRVSNIWKKLNAFAKGHDASLSSVIMRSTYLYFWRNINLDDQIFNQALNPHLPLEEAKQFVGNKEFAEFQRAVNSPYTQCISDKTLFAHLAKSLDFPHPETFLFFEHNAEFSLAHGLTAEFDVLSTKAQWLEYLQDALPDRFIVKSSHGRSAIGIEVFERSKNGTFRGRTRQYTLPQIYQKVVEDKAYGKCIFQHYLKGHSAIAELTGTDTIQTVRLVTAKNEIGEISMYCGFLKMVGNPDTVVDNFHGGQGGNMMATIDLDKGTIETATGFDSEVCKHVFPTVHPHTQNTIVGFKLPFWHELTECSMALHAKIPGVRVIGWDIAITEDGPVVLEGNPECGDMSPKWPWMTRQDMEYLKSLLFTQKKHRFPAPVEKIVSGMAR